MTPAAPRRILRGGRVLDPASGRDERADVVIADGRILAVEAPGDLGAGFGRAGAEIIEIQGCLVTPGLVDLHVHLREPGGEAKETIASGAAAAAAGGFTTVCAMPNTSPIGDTPEWVRFVRERGAAARGARVLPIAAATVGSGGEVATDAVALRAAGAVALSDDGRPIATAEMLAEVLGGARAAGLVVADHCEALELSARGAILEGPLADRLRVRGIPATAESAAVARDLEVLAQAGGRLHLCHLSTAASVELLAAARARGLDVTAEVSPHHLVLTTETVAEAGTLAKMNPPLASRTDRAALRAALAEGVIDCVATDHAPHTAAEKASGLAAAPFGVIGLETAFGVLHTELVLTGGLGLATLIDRMAFAPVRAFGLEAGRLEPGGRADLAVFDLEARWVVEPGAFCSLGRNTPFGGRSFTGRPILTLVDGEIVHDGR
ncbi:MAG: dihydroorotase [Gemmatimonadota bacterium]